MKRSLHLTAELLRLYSRRNNFHSDVDAAADIGYERLVAQGMQAAAPAYGLLLDEWGESLLASGTVEFTFVDMVVDDETVDADVTFDAPDHFTFDAPDHSPDHATFTVTCGTRAAVVGTATRILPASEPAGPPRRSLR